MTGNKPKILYVEDDIHLSYVTKDNLEIKGYEVVHCENGKKALQAFRREHFDLCVVDVMLPEMDGFALAKKIRETDRHIPILFLTARSMKEDRIEGLMIGGDDYITKPFSIEELILRIGVFLKRNRVNERDPDESMIRLGDTALDPANLILTCGGHSCTLTPMEAELLKFFFHHPGRLLKRDEILNAVWGNDTYYNSRSLDVFVSRLRKHLKKDKNLSINNVHGQGFMLTVKER